MDALSRLSKDPRVTVRRAGPADPDGTCVARGIQPAQRGIDMLFWRLARSLRRISATVRSWLREFPTWRPLWRTVPSALCFAVTRITVCCAFVNR